MKAKAQEANGPGKGNMSQEYLSLAWTRFTRRKRFTQSSLQESKLDRCLTTFDLTALGIGATLGVGIYVLAGSVAKDVAGPSVVLSFFVAGLASALSGLCYAEMGARVPKAGSAYVYSYTTVGEFIAFIIGWNLVLEYVIGTAGVARGYSGYLDSLLNKTMAATFRAYLPINVPYLSPYPDLCALGITLLLTFILCIGVKESTRFNNLFTCLNLFVVAFVTVLGLIKSNLSNWNLSVESIPSEIEAGEGGFFPYGIEGTLAGAATCFFGYVGFDSIATSGEETKNPQKSIPIAICASLFFVFLAYFGVSSSLTLMVPYYLQDADAPLPAAFKRVGWNFAGWVVSVGALFGLSTSLLGAMFPLPRVLYAMASDGLIPRALAYINVSCQTPVRATLISGTFAGLMAAMFDLKNLVDMMSIGTLMAYTIVGACVILLRYQDLPGLDAVASSISSEMIGITNGGKEYMPLKQTEGRVRTTTGLPTLSSDSEKADDEDDELIYCHRNQLDSRSVIEEEDLNLIPPGKKRKKNVDREAVFGSFSKFLTVLTNAQRLRAPTGASSSMASILTVYYSIFAFGLALLLQYNISTWGTGTYLMVGLFTFSMILALLCLCLQPQTTHVLSFKVPGVPLLPAISIFVNLYLMLKLSPETWVRFAVWMAVGFAVYFGYGWRNSSEEYRLAGRKPPDPNDSSL